MPATIKSVRELRARQVQKHSGMAMLDRVSIIRVVSNKNPISKSTWVHEQSQIFISISFRSYELTFEFGILKGKVAITAIIP